MGAIFIALGAYLTTVGYRGKSEAFVKDVIGAKGFVLWGAALGVLYLLYENKTTKPLAYPFGTITLLALLIKGEPELAKQFKTLYAEIVSKPKPPSATQQASHTLMNDVQAEQSLTSITGR